MTARQAGAGEPRPPRGEAREPEDADLVAEIEWLRRLALRVTGGDVHAAEDLAQETLTVALERSPRSPASLRRWLARVLRNRLFMRLRADERRRAREEEVARLALAAEQAGAEHPLEEAERLARVRAAVRRLREPYQRAILLRYELGLPMREIAARLALSPRTVEGHLARGLDLLRSELVGAPERRRPFAALLGFLLPRRRARGQAGARVSANAALQGGVLLGAAGLAALALLARDAGSGAPQPANGGLVATAPAAPVLALPAGRREAVALASDFAVRAPEPVDVTRLEGLVVDLVGAPVPGASVWLEAVGVGEDTLHTFGESGVRAERWSLAGGQEQVESGADGRFQLSFESRDLPYFLRASAAKGESSASILGTYVVEGNAARERTLVLAPLRNVEGSVRDEFGAPLAGARARLRAPKDVARPTGRAVVLSAAFSATVRTDEGGRFRFEQVPFAAGSRLEIERLGRLRATVVLDGGPGPVDVVLEPDPTVRVLRGRVVDRGGTPLERAHVVGGGRLVRTDGAGEFELAVDAASPPAELVAVAPGRRAARVPAPASGAGPVEILAGEPALALEGRVVDERGEPLAGGLIWPLDLEILGWASDRTPLAAEVLAIGGGVEWFTNGVDEGGRFRIDGLGDRDYRLRVGHMSELWGAEAGPFRAGTSGIVVRVDRGGAPGLRGVVRDRDGIPLEGVRVQGRLEVWRAPHPEGGEPFQRFGGVGAASTDARGSFALPLAGGLPMRVRLMGPGILGREIDVPEGGELEIVAVRRRRLEVRLAPGFAGDAVRFLDAEGRSVTVADEHAGAFPWQGERAEVSAGSPRVLLVPESAVQVRLEKDGQPMLERPLPPFAEGTLLLPLP